MKNAPLVFMLWIEFFLVYAFRLLYGLIQIAKMLIRNFLRIYFDCRPMMQVRVLRHNLGINNPGLHHRFVARCFDVPDLVKYSQREIFFFIHPADQHIKFAGSHFGVFHVLPVIFDNVF